MVVKRNGSRPRVTTFGEINLGALNHLHLWNHLFDMIVGFHHLSTFLLLAFTIHSTDSTLTTVGQLPRQKGNPLPQDKDPAVTTMGPNDRIFLFGLQSTDDLTADPFPAVESCQTGV